jgi:hypothetical protein
VWREAGIRRRRPATVIGSRQLGANLMMTDISGIPGAMMVGMGLIWLLVLAFLVLGIAAFIKYLRS